MQKLHSRGKTCSKLYQKSIEISHDSDTSC